MKHSLAFLTFFLLSVCCLAQRSSHEVIIPLPTIQVNNIGRGENPVRISDVKIDVKIVGSLAVTTVDMIFHNPNNRVMEGELQFPLADGQSISRFALDINNKLREGVVVEKAKGQEAFESIIRQGVDPGLLEKTQGNNFKTRVYPLPARGTRHIVIAYEQELMREGENYRFFLPVDYRDKLDSFDLNISVFGSDYAPKTDKTPWGSFTFDKAGDAYLASYSAKSYQATGQLVFSIPVKDNKKLFVEKGQISGQTFFYSQIFPKIQSNSKKSPSRIALFWDASSSMDKRNFKLESELLSAYFQEIGNVTVDVYTFNCILNKSETFNIRNGNWESLRTKLNNIAYDGATQLGALNFNSVRADEILLFTDGLSNFGKQDPQTGSTPISVINSALSADHSMLKYLASTTGGKYINLLQETPQEALNILKNESYRLISADYNKSDISEFTTSGSVIKSGSGFSMSGKLNVSRTTVTLHFGIGNQKHHSETIVIEARDAGNYGNIVERVWAQKKIAELDQLYDKNKDEIESIGRKYNIVTRNTSLIVLDRVEDYVQYKIVPPAELLADYNAILDRINTEEKNMKEYMISNVVSYFYDRKEWWNKEFPKEPIRPIEPPKKFPVNRSGNINGTVTDTRGEPLIGIIVSIKGTNQGTMTDVDGVFYINATHEQTLIFSYVGFTPKEIKVLNNRTINVILEEDALMLDESVVVAYGMQRRESANTDSWSVSNVAAARLSDAFSDIVADESVSADYEMASTEELYKVKKEERIGSFPASSAKIQLKGWNPNAPYLDLLKTKSNKDLYNEYLKIRGEYKDTPSFFLDVATLFEEKGLKEEALIILSNLAELEVENYRMLRVLAHRLKQLGYTDYAINQFEVVLKLRPEEPQSYRDLGLTYSQNKEYQKAVDMLYKIIERSWDGRFPRIQLIAAEEMNEVIAKAKLDRKALNLKGIDERLIFNMPVDIRIVLNWDTDNSDMDLWVTDPYGEKCYYSNKLTRIGGLMSDDFTGGYGPEEFLIKEAVKGKYKIQANYYGSREQTLIGPTTIYLDIFTYYASGREKKETITLRLTQNKEVIDIGEVTFGK